MGKKPTPAPAAAAAAMTSTTNGALPAQESPPALPAAPAAPASPQPMTAYETMRGPASDLPPVPYEDDQRGKQLKELELDECEYEPGSEPAEIRAAIQHANAYCRSDVGVSIPRAVIHDMILKTALARGMSTLKDADDAPNLKPAAVAILHTEAEKFITELVQRARRMAPAAATELPPGSVRLCFEAHQDARKVPVRYDSMCEGDDLAEDLAAAERKEQAREAQEAAAAAAAAAEHADEGTDPPATPQPKKPKKAKGGAEPAEGSPASAPVPTKKAPKKRAREEDDPPAATKQKHPAPKPKPRTTATPTAPPNKTTKPAPKPAKPAKDAAGAAKPVAKKPRKSPPAPAKTPTLTIDNVEDTLSIDGDDGEHAHAQPAVPA